MANKNGFDDDGRIVADMSGIEGPNMFSVRGFGKKREKSELPKSDSEMTSEERRIYLKAALLSTLAIASVFIVACALFILFCQHIWFK